MKSIIATIVGLLLVAGLLGGVKGAQIGALIAAAEQGGPPPDSVTTAVAGQSEWRRVLSAVGTTVPVQGVTIAPEVPGVVTRIAFESGQDVRAGQVLLRMDTSVEQAELASAEAEARLTQRTYERAEALRQRSVTAQSELDQAESLAKQAEARVSALKATIAKKTVRAPFAGRLGIRQVNLGQFVAVGTPVVSLQSLGRLYVDFSLPQRQLSQLAGGQDVSIRTDAYPGRTWAGQVDTLDASIDPSTRNLRVRGIIDNDGRVLRPGMFVDVEITLPSVRQVVTVPATSIIYAPYSDSAFVVEEPDGVKEPAGSMKVVKQVFVRLGERRGDLVEVVDGIEAGQEVVSTGAFKLRNGASVVVNNDLAPQPELDPDPKDS